MPIFKKASVAPIVRTVISQGIEDFKPQQSKPKITSHENENNSLAHELVNALNTEIQNIQNYLDSIKYNDEDYDLALSERHAFEKALQITKKIFSIL